MGGLGTIMAPSSLLTAMPNSCHNGTIELSVYIENINRQLLVAGEAGGDEARALAERLIAPLDAAIRLALQDVLSAAAEEITCELAPGSVELRVRGRNPEFVVTAPPMHSPGEDLSDAASIGGPARTTGGPRVSSEAEDGTMSRINLRMPEQLKGRIEQAAGHAGLSVNAWLVQAAAAALERGSPDGRRELRAAHGAQRYTGWAR